MRGGVSLAAALAIPLETAAGPFPFRDLLIFITFVVLLATLVGQGGTLPWLIRWLKIKDDGAAVREERLAIVVTARAGLHCLDRLEKEGTYPADILGIHRFRLEARLGEFTSPMAGKQAAKNTALFRQSYNLVIEAERTRLIELRRLGKIDNTVLRQVQRLLDLETLEVEMLGSTGHSELEE